MPCSKRLPGVRDAFSEALRAQNRLLGYGRDIRYRKRPPTVRDASSKASRTADSTNCVQPPAAPDASSVRETTRSDVSRHKKKEGDLSVYQDFLELPAAPVLLPPHAYIAASAPSSKKIKKVVHSVYQVYHDKINFLARRPPKISACKQVKV